MLERDFIIVDMFIRVLRHILIIKFSHVKVHLKQIICIHDNFFRTQFSFPLLHRPFIAG